jgi:hypothetical protein
LSPEYLQQPEKRQLSDDDRLLTEVDHLVRDLENYGEFRVTTLNDIKQNLMTATQEQAMPYAVTETRHESVYDTERQQRTFMWLGKTAVQTALSGYEYHRHESAHKRVDIEVDEARHASSMEEGRVRILISPRMSRKDAPIDIAKNEHLADDDSVRVSWLESKNGKTERVMQSLLVRDIPLEAWVSMLEDEDNLFGKSFSVEDKESALSVMKLHRELELPKELVANGPVTIIEAVIPYISDAPLRKKVIEQSKKYTVNQNELRYQAEITANEWLKFEQSIAESLVIGVANYDVRRFIAMMQNQFTDSDLEIINRHQLEDAQYRMSRELAAIVESAQQRLLNGRASVITDNEDATRHVVDKQALQRVRDTEVLIQTSRMQGLDVRALEAQQNRDVAQLSIKPSGGCGGQNRTEFRNDGDVPENSLKTTETSSDSEGKESWTWKEGVCQVKACDSRPGKTKVGPCSICVKCQAVFDSGGDPTKDNTKEQLKPTKTEKTRVQKAIKPAKLAVEQTLESRNEQFALAG